jgi:hypothetical protein
MKKYKPKQTRTNNILQRIVTNKKQSIENRQTKLTNLRQEIKLLHNEWEKCIGPCNILKAKTIHRKIQLCKTKIDLLTSSTIQKQQVFNLMTQNDQLETTRQHFENNNVGFKLHDQISASGRLYPEIKSRFSNMSIPKIQKWQNLRAHQKRHSIMSEKNMPIKNYNLDFCEKCKVERIVVREHARSICPICADSKTFASHLFETTYENTKKIKKTHIDHMEKGITQYTRGFPSTQNTILEKMSLNYNNIHSHDPFKVQAVLTGKLITDCKDLPNTMSNNRDRLSRELKSQSIPEYTQKQINSLINQRDRLKPDQRNLGTKCKQKKHSNNIVYFRQFGLASNMENSRLFPPLKTNSKHLEGCRALEKVCQDQLQKTKKTNWSWELKPFS